MTSLLNLVKLSLSVTNISLSFCLFNEVIERIQFNIVAMKSMRLMCCPEIVINWVYCIERVWLCGGNWMLL